MLMMMTMMIMMMHGRVLNCVLVHDSVLNKYHRERERERENRVSACLVYFVVAGSKPFHLAHVEFRSTFVTVERGRPVVAGTALIARFTSNSEADALMFTEDPQTQNIVTVDGKLCVTDDDNGVHNLVSNRL